MNDKQTVFEKEVKELFERYGANEKWNTYLHECSQKHELPKDNAGDWIFNTWDELEKEIEALADKYLPDAEWYFDETIMNCFDCYYSSDYYTESDSDLSCKETCTSYPEKCSDCMWNDPAAWADAHRCTDYDNGSGYCTYCGAIIYGTSAYYEAYGCDPPEYD